MAKTPVPKSFSLISGEEGSLHRYLQEIQQFPMLAPEEEYQLGKDWREHGNKAAAEKLVTSHLRLVAKIALGYRGYGLPMSEVISEGNIGLMKAVQKFEPEKGFKLATYAMWWIKATIQEYVLRSWSIVKIGTTAAQKKLFFNLRRLKSRIAATASGELTAQNIETIAKTLSVEKREVVEMDQRLSGDRSLNVVTTFDGEGEQQWQDSFADQTPNQEVQLQDQQESQLRDQLLQEGLKKLPEREREILIARKLKDEPETLEELSVRYKVSRERIRQIEVSAFTKLQKNIKAAAQVAKLAYN